MVYTMENMNQCSKKPCKKMGTKFEKLLLPIDSITTIHFLCCCSPTPSILLPVEVGTKREPIKFVYHHRDETFHIATLQGDNKRKLLHRHDQDRKSLLIQMFIMPAEPYAALFPIPLRFPGLLDQRT